MFNTCTTCDIKCCDRRVNDGIKGCADYYNKNINTLEGIMMLNENYHKEVKAAPLCPFNQVQALEEWFRDCAKQWLEGFKKEIEQFPTTDELSIYYRNINLELIKKLLASINKKRSSNDSTSTNHSKPINLNLCPSLSEKGSI